MSDLYKAISGLIGNKIEYFENLRTGEITADNGDGTYDVKIANADSAYPNVETLDYGMTFSIKEIVIIGFEYGNKESPKILGSAKKIAQEPKIVEVDYSEPVIEIGWNLLTATYDEISKYLRDKESTPYSFRISSDGTKLYVVGGTSGTVFQYTFGTAWDISTIFYSGKSFPLGDSGCDYPYGMSFSPNGDKMYVLDGSYDEIFQYTLDTLWDVDTASFDSKTFVVTDQCPSPWDIYMKPDGTKVYVIGIVNDKVYQYTLNTPWDISSAVYDEKFLYVREEDGVPFDLSFKSDGTQVFILGGADDKVYHYNIDTSWDISTAVYDDVNFALAGQSITNARCLFFKTDGTKMYVLAYNDYTIYQYTLGSK